MAPTGKVLGREISRVRKEAVSPLYISQSARFNVTGTMHVLRSDTLLAALDSDRHFVGKKAGADPVVIF